MWVKVPPEVCSMEGIIYSFTNASIEDLPTYPWCETCGDIVVRSEGFVSILAINSDNEYHGGVCGECCGGSKDMAMNLFMIGFAFRPREAVPKPEVEIYIEVEIE